METRQADGASESSSAGAAAEGAGSGTGGGSGGKSKTFYAVAVGRTVSRRVRRDCVPWLRLVGTHTRSSAWHSIGPGNPQPPSHICPPPACLAFAALLLPYVTCLLLASATSPRAHRTNPRSRSLMRCRWGCLTTGRRPATQCRASAVLCSSKSVHEHACVWHELWASPRHVSYVARLFMPSCVGPWRPPSCTTLLCTRPHCC